MVTSAASRAIIRPMHVEISAEERELLIRLVERALSDTRVEVRRTKTPEFHDRLQVEEQQLSALLVRLRTGAGA
jgi:hypothetical protein